MASDFSIRHAAHIIRSGGVIAYPSDTIYGLGCDPYNPGAVERINTIKQRPSNKQFILLAGNIEQIKPLIQISKDQEILLTQNNEPTSWVVNAKPSAPNWLTDNNNTLTIRISNHENIKQLIHILGHAIISTSANISGKKPATNALQLHQYFHRKVDKILISNTKQSGKPSKIIRLCDNYIFRK